MLFKVEPNEDFFLANPEAKSIKEFADCSDKEMKYVAMFTDYLSPLRQQPEPERKRLACLAAGYAPQDTHQKTMQPKVREMINGQKAHVEAAIAKYKEIQYNGDRELLKLYQTQIDSIKTMIQTPTTDAAELKKRNDLILSLPELHKSQRELAKTAGLEDEIENIEKESANKNLSMIDRVHAEEAKSNEM